MSRTGTGKEEEEEESEDEEEVRKLQSCAINTADLLLGSSSSRIVTSKNDSRYLSFKSTPPSHSHNDCHQDSVDHSGGLKLYQIRVQDLLHNYLDKKLGRKLSEFVEDEEEPTSEKEEVSSIRLFRRAPCGITLSPKVVAITRKANGRNKNGNASSEEDSSESFDHLQEVAVDGAIVQAEAERAAARALAAVHRELKAAQLAAKEEEERVASLKKERGEEWLPSLGKEMATWQTNSHQNKSNKGSKKRKAFSHTREAIVVGTVLPVKNGV